MSNPIVRNLSGKITLSEPTNDGSTSISNASPRHRLVELEHKFRNDSRVVFNVDASDTSSIITNDNGRVQYWLSNPGATGVHLVQDIEGLMPSYVASSPHNHKPAVYFKKPQYMASSGHMQYLNEKIMLVVAASVEKSAHDNTSGQFSEIELMYFGKSNVNSQYSRIRVGQTNGDDPNSQLRSFRNFLNSHNPDLLNSPDRPSLGEVLVCAQCDQCGGARLFQIYKGKEYVFTSNTSNDGLNCKFAVARENDLAPGRFLNGYIYQAIGLIGDSIDQTLARDLCEMLELKWGAKVTRKELS